MAPLEGSVVDDGQDGMSWWCVIASESRGRTARRTGVGDGGQERGSQL